MILGEHVDPATAIEKSLLYLLSKMRGGTDIEDRDAVNTQAEKL